MQCIFNAGFFLFHFNFGRSADFDHCNAADQLGQSLLELLAIVVGGGLLDLGADLLDTAGNGVFLAVAVDDGGVVLVNSDALGAAEHVDGGLVEFEADLFRDHLTAGQNSDVFQHGLAAVAEAGSLDGADVQHAAQLVDHQGSQGLALDVFSDDQQRTA